MPLIPQEIKTKRNYAKFNLDINVLADLDSYCRFTDSSRDFVVENILGYVFKKDREFQDWLASNPAAPQSKTEPSPTPSAEPPSAFGQPRPSRPKPTTGAAADAA